MDQENQNPTSESTNISLQDLVILLNLIRASAERGAVRADEMTVVGSVYEKLLTFLKSTGAIKSSDSSPLIN